MLLRSSLHSQLCSIGFGMSNTLLRCLCCFVALLSDDFAQFVGGSRLNYSIVPQIPQSSTSCVSEVSRLLPNK